MTAKHLTALLVGAHFRPPAKQLLTVLPNGTPLQLVPEPENPYDDKAIKVLVDLAAASLPVDSEAVNAALEGTGFTIEDLLAAEDPLHLGYIAAAKNKAMIGRLDFASNVTLWVIWDDEENRPWYAASLAFDPAGQPLVLIPYSGEEQ